MSGKDVSEELSKLSTWFAVNKLSFNVSKTNFMLFSNNKKTSSINVNINYIDTEMVYVSTFLSVLIDRELNWKDHVGMIVSLLSKSIAIMHRAKYLLDKNARLILLYAITALRSVGKYLQNKY